MPGLKEIAEAAGVSVRTVSRALKGKGYVSPATMEAVQAAAKKLAYRPNRFARSLRTQKSHEVAVLAWSFDELQMAKIAGFEQSMRQAEYTVTTIFDRAGLYLNNPQALAEELTARKPAGVMLLTAQSALGEGMGQLSDALAQADIPSVFVDTYDYTGVDSVRIDRQQGVYEAVLYLAKSGRKRIAYLGPHDPSRLDGYRRAITELGREEIHIELPAEPDYDVSYQAAARYAAMTQRPDAIQVYSDFTAMAFLAGLHDLGVDVPNELAVVGFDDRDAAKYAWPALTTVAQPNTQVGQAAAEILLARIDGGTTPPKGWSKNLPTRLVIRKSS